MSRLGGEITTPSEGKSNRLADVLPFWAKTKRDQKLETRRVEKILNPTSETTNENKSSKRTPRLRRVADHAAFVANIIDTDSLEPREVAHHVDNEHDWTFRHVVAANSIETQLLQVKYDDFERTMTTLLEKRLIKLTPSEIQAGKSIEDKARELRLAMQEDDEGCAIWAHSRRVSELAANTFATLGKNKRTQRLIRITAMTHDVGKGINSTELPITNNILIPGRLTNEQMDIVHKHSTEGAQIIEENPLRLTRSASQRNEFVRDQERISAILGYDVTYDEVVTLYERLITLTSMVVAACHHPMSPEHNREYLEQHRSELEALFELFEIEATIDEILETITIADMTDSLSHKRAYLADRLLHEGHIASADKKPLLPKRKIKQIVRGNLRLEGRRPPSEKINLMMDLAEYMCWFSRRSTLSKITQLVFRRAEIVKVESPARASTTRQQILDSLRQNLRREIDFNNPDNDPDSIQILGSLASRACVAA